MAVSPNRGLVQQHLAADAGIVTHPPAESIPFPAFWRLLIFAIILIFPIALIGR
jgi:hypothetical protein